MEYRKIIEFGKSSYVVSLPKDWLTEKKLKKGDVVYLDKDSEKLVLYPVKKSSSNNIKKGTIDVTGMTKEEIKLQLVSKYILNFNEITLTSENMKSKAKDIRNIIHDMMALEVIEEDASKIVTKAFINIEEISPTTLLNKMDIITRDMLSDSIKSFEEDRAENISERDLDVNRISYLFFRTMRHIQSNPSMARKNNIKHPALLAMWITALKIEHVADQAKRVAKLMRRLDLHKNEQEEFCKLYSAIENYYIDTMDVFYKGDSDKAFKLITNQKKLVKQCRDFYRQNWDHEWVPVILEKLKEIISETKSILTYVCDSE